MDKNEPKTIDYNREYDRINTLKTEITINMYIFLIGIIVIGVNTILFPFITQSPELSLTNLILSNGEFIFVIEMFVLVGYFAVILYFKKVKLFIRSCLSRRKS